MMIVDISKRKKFSHWVSDVGCQCQYTELLRFDTCFVEALSLTLTKDEKIFHCFRKYDRPQQ